LERALTRALALVRTSARRVAEHGLPQQCELCAAPSRSTLVCAACSRTLPRAASACSVCALPLVGGDVCGRCQRKPPAFERTVAAFTYAYPVDRLLHAFKYRGRLALAHWCASELRRAISSAAIDTAGICIVAMPLGQARQRERGFNQALEIARRVAASLEAELAQGLVGRTREAPPQTALAWSERAANVRGAFVCVDDVRGRDIAVIDDVMTTGASLQELARTLKDAGARSVQNWVIARTLPPLSA
jgi:ComF family protein